MNSFQKEEFKEYLETKVASATAQTYASDMLVCVKAFEEITAYKGKDLVEVLEDFLSNKKVNKNYLYDEFLDALVKVGSSDTGLYGSLASKAKHYLAMKNSNKETIASNNTIDVTVKLAWENQDSSEEEDLEKVYTMSVNKSYDTAQDIINLIIKDQTFLSEVLEDTKNLFDDMSIIQLYFSDLTVEDKKYISFDYIDGEDEYYELSACRFFFPNGKPELEFFMRD